MSIFLICLNYSSKFLEITYYNKFLLLETSLPSIAFKKVGKKLQMINIPGNFNELLHTMERMENTF